MTTKNAKLSASATSKRRQRQLYCAIGDGNPLKSNAERKAGLCAYHLATLPKQ